MAAGCATFPPPSTLPQKEADFRLPARELVTRFPVVQDLHGDHRRIFDQTPTLRDIETLWGDATSQHSYWEAEVTKYTILAGLGATAGHAMPPALLGALLITPALLTYKPMQKYVWEKGEYRITGTFGKTIFHNEPQLVAWEWARRDLRGTKIIYHPWLTVINDFGGFATFDHTVGGDLIGVSGDGKIRLRAGDNTEFALGWRVPLLDKGVGLRLSLGYRYSGFVGMIQGVTLTQYPARAVLEFQLRDSVLRAGVGAVYALHPVLTIEDYTGAPTKYEYPDAPGVVLQMEFRPLASAGIGVRYEYLPMENLTKGKIDASSIGMYWAWYF
ncbi:MAG: hypothetical protein AABY83_00590 [Pseudomonadota bacterium]